jgi:glycosyltransferase involved in cell wall biosynthesis
LGRDLISSLDKDCTIFHIPQYSEGDLVKKAYDLNSPVEILSVSNLEFVEKANGVIWLIKSLNEFCVKNKVKINFKVAGNGISKKDVDIFLKEKQLSKFLNVKMLGFVSSLDHFYEKADVFLYRSFHDATPNVILESKRYGLPLIVNYSEEFSLIVDHDVNGCLYKNKNEFFNYLYDIVFDKQLRVRLGENAQNDFTKKYSVAAVAELFEHVFRDFKFESKI